MKWCHFKKFSRPEIQSRNLMQSDKLTLIPCNPGFFEVVLSLECDVSVDSSLRDLQRGYAALIDESTY